jgi:hypothetical protein
MIVRDWVTRMSRLFVHMGMSRTLINRCEGCLLPPIEAYCKLDLWCRALAKIGKAGGSRIGRGDRTRTCNWPSLIIQRCDGGEFGLDSKHYVEGISLRTRLGSLLISCCQSRGAGCPGSLISTAAINKSVAHKLGDDIDVLRRAMVV